MRAPTDKNDREIMVGDTLKVFHFVARLRRKKHYMYKYVHERRGSWLNLKHLNIEDGDYSLQMKGQKLENYEIVQGFGPDSTDFEDRPKVINNIAG